VKYLIDKELLEYLRQKRQECNLLIINADNENAKINNYIQSKMRLNGNDARVEDSIYDQCIKSINKNMTILLENKGKIELIKELSKKIIDSMTEKDLRSEGMENLIMWANEKID